MSLVCGALLAALVVSDSLLEGVIAILGAALQLLKPLVADSKAVPPTPNVPEALVFSELT